MSRYSSPRRGTSAAYRRRPCRTTGNSHDRVTEGCGGPVETGMRIRGMLDQQLNNDLHPQLPRLFNKGDDIVELAEAGIDLQMVAHVIAFIEKRREVKR